MSCLLVVAAAAPSQADAREVVYQARGGVVMARTDDRTPRRLAQGTRPQVSPNARYVAFVNPDHTQVRLVPYRGGHQRVIARGHDSAVLNPRFLRTTWSADSRYVATAEVGNKISLYDTRRRRTSVLRRYPLGTELAGLAFSPSGARIAYSTVGHDDQSLLVMAAKSGAHATVIRRGDGADPVWGANAGCLAFTLLRGDRYDFAPSRIGLSCASQDGRRTFGEGTGSFRALRWISRTRLLGTESVGQSGQQEQAVALDTASGQIIVVSQPVQHIFDFSRDGRRMLARIGTALTQAPLVSADGAAVEIARNPVLASWTGA